MGFLTEDEARQIAKKMLGPEAVVYVNHFAPRIHRHAVFERFIHTTPLASGRSWEEALGRADSVLNDGSRPAAAGNTARTSGTASSTRRRKRS